jgi:hypothetical protein
MNGFMKEQRNNFQGVFKILCWRYPAVFSAPRAGSLDE